MKITRETFKNIVKETMIEESEYQEFFKRALEKTGKSIPDMSDEEKKAFFNKIDAAWQGKGEKNEELVGNQHKLDVDGDGEIEASDLAALRAGKKVDEAANLKTIAMLFQNKGIKDAVRKDHADKLRKIIEDGGVSTKGVSDSELIKVVKQLTSESVEEASTSSAPGNWVAYLSMTRGKMLLKVFDTARGAKQYLSKNIDKLLGLPHVENVGIMTKKQWDEREAKYAIEGVNEASKPTIKVVTKLKNEQGIQIVVVKTTQGETLYAGFVVRGKLQKVIPVGANKTKEDVKKRALQIWDEFGKQLGETVNENKFNAYISSNDGKTFTIYNSNKEKVKNVSREELEKLMRVNGNHSSTMNWNTFMGKFDKTTNLGKHWKYWKGNLINVTIPSMSETKSVNEGTLGDTWKKNNKKGYILKVGNIELKSAGPSNSHDILVNRMPWGTFAIDYEAGGTDWWVKPMRGSDFWVKSIDDLVKKVKADSRFKESVVNEEITVGKMVKVVDNPHWEAALGKKGPFKRKVKMIDGDNVFFTDGSNSSMKYVKESVEFTITEALVPVDKKAVDAFFNKKDFEGKNLNSDGKVLKTVGVGSQEMYIHTPKGVKMVGKVTGQYAQSVVQYVNKNHKSDLV